MRFNLVKIILATALVAVMSGCATQNMRSGNEISPLCMLAGAAVGGGATAAAGLAAGPIGVVAMAGLIIGNEICRTDEEPAPQQVAAAPSQPRAAEPVRDLDSDGDGVIDRLDRCPGTPAGVRVNAQGCPDILLTLTGVNFKFDSSNIEPASERILNQGVEALNNANSVEVRIVGHTDSVGTDAYNLKLSERRANAVRDYLTGHGINGVRLTTAGAGESQPVATNDTDDGRYQNRRVEFHVTGSK